jgi:putative Mg2+ transporter-C (MgtC) family protein
MNEQLIILGYVILATLLGGIIGLDRELAQKPAGLRTHMLVAGSAALLTGLSEILVNSFDIATDFINVDPIRIVEAIITGVSFLGAGTIVRQRGEDQGEGLTTAASVLLAAAIGITVALQQYVLAVGTTILILLVLRVLQRFHTFWDR